MKVLRWWVVLSMACVADSKSIGADSGGGSSTDGGSTLPAACQGAFEDSWDTWHNVMMMQGTTYVYTRVEQTTMDADPCDQEPALVCNLRTTITVEAGMPSSRELVVMPDQGTPVDACPAAFVEGQAELGTHPGGAPALTMDQLYQGCCDVAAMGDGFGTDFGQASFTIDATGVLAGCSDLLCDDCGCFSSVDYTIEDLAFAN